MEGVESMNFFEIVLTLAISLGAVVWGVNIIFIIKRVLGFLLDGIR